jgi:hypothetical protein
MPRPSQLTNKIIIISESTNYTRGTQYYAASWNVAGLRPDEGASISPIYLILAAALRPGVYTDSNRNEDQKQK